MAMLIKNNLKRLVANTVEYTNFHLLCFVKHGLNLQKIHYNISNEKLGISHFNHPR